MGKLYYCPFCGTTQNESDSICRLCEQHTTMTQSKHEYIYYLKKSVEVYGNYYHFDDVFFEEDVLENPLYDEKYKKKAEETRQRIVEYGKSIERSTSSLNQDIPKCPTCQSTNIKKISSTKRAAHGYLFGIFSKTAFSQFECKNCGYKW